MDKDLFVQQVDQHSGMMYRVALTILRNDEDCKDALQEAALKAWAKRHSLRDQGLFATWMTRIVINECHNILRKRKRVVVMEHLPERAAPEQDLSLYLTLDSLPDKYRLPLVLRYSEGMTEQQIAKTLGLSAAAVRGRLYRGRQRLKKELEG
ncbi:MAG: sigma-70 family RNA polymerase sigma factor [Clostridiales bacterium]|nr:sigma-70 family RNA polymerase sigma factor [Clostridiales bacterium]